jgi:hypothetical protein
MSLPNARSPASAQVTVDQLSEFLYDEIVFLLSLSLYCGQTKNVHEAVQRFPSPHAQIWQFGSRQGRGTMVPSTEPCPQSHWIAETCKQNLSRERSTKAALQTAGDTAFYSRSSGNMLYCLCWHLYSIVHSTHSNIFSFMFRLYISFQNEYL